MWGAFSKIFKKNAALKEGQSGEPAPQSTADPQDMDDSIITKQAKQRASIKWILSKAFNNKVPENLKEPFYQDHEGQEHLKPQIAGGLANAEIYCRALANIYSDPNYHSLNHSAILHALARKGISASEPTDGAQLTETTLIQTNPLRMTAHMVVIESVMLLYAREVVTPDRVLAAVQRFTHNQTQAASSIPTNHEQALLLWVQMACSALRQRIEQDKDGLTNGGGDAPRIPQFPPCRDLKDLCDGVCLCGLLAFYCPDEVHWSDIKISQIASVQGSLHNLRTIFDFCLRCLPASIFHLQAEDIFYLSESMRPNLIVFLADLFNVIEIHPANCIKEKFSGEEFPARNEHGVPHKRNLLQPVVTPIPDLRSSLDDPSAATAFQVNKSNNLPLRRLNSLQSSQQTLDFSEDSIQPRSESRANSEESFVIHRGRNVPTLRSVINDDPVIGRARTREKQNSEEREDAPVAGKPSHWDEHKKTGYAGRRSRKNSTTDDSQLTIENFGGSQDNISFIGRNPDKEVGAHVGRKISAPSFPVAVENPRVRSSLQDAKGSFQIGYDYDNGCEKRDTMEKTRLKRQMSSDDITLRNLEKKQDLVDGEVSNNRMSFADLGKQKEKMGEYRGIQLVDREEYSPKQRNGNSEKKTSFDILPNTTTWQQQSLNMQSHENTNGSENPGTNNMQLNDIRLKLEEKRRHIESEKRRMEAAMNKQRQKVGKAAFLQAVTKGRANVKSAGSDSGESKGSSAASPGDSRTPSLPELAPAPSPSPKPQRPFTLQDIPNEISNVERKWFDDTQPYIETRRTPDLENMDYEQYQKSLAQMNSSLTDIQSDIQQLAAQQNLLQIQTEQKAIAEQQRQLLHMQQQQLQQQQFQSMQKQPQPSYVNQFSYQPQMYQQPSMPAPLQSSSSAPHIPQSFVTQRLSQQLEPQFFLHDNSLVQSPAPVVPPRRTWAQQQQSQPINDRPEMKTWGRPQAVQQQQQQQLGAYGEEPQHAGGGGGGFVLHDVSKRLQDLSRFQDSPLRQTDNRYQNGGGDNDTHRGSPQANHSFTLSQQYHKQFGTVHNTPSASPQHHNIHRQISQLLSDGSTGNKRSSPISLQQLDSGGGGGGLGNTVIRERKTSVTHAPVAAPPADDMEPQNISFIGNSEDDHLSKGLSRLNIDSGTRTYRIPSPTRPLISRNSFQPSPSPPLATELPENREEDHTSQKGGFYLSFDNEGPIRPKPPFRNRSSPKKERSFVKSANESTLVRPNKIDSHDKENRLERDRLQNDASSRMEQRIEQEREKFRVKREVSQDDTQKVTAASAMVIGEVIPNPETLDELERKKERILMLSMQRKQQLEEARTKKEAEALRKRELDKAKEEEKERKKAEQAARRQVILEQYKLKKAIEEAEREGKTLDVSHLQLQSLKPTPKMRPKGGATGRPRPKTIHIDSGSVQMAENMSSKGRKGSTSNLNYAGANTMKRDYYRGSTDSLHDRSMSHTMLYNKDSPDDSRSHGMVSPCNSTNPVLGRRSSYQRTSTSRDPSPAQVRGRPRVSTLQNLKGRKSSSMMNLYGSSTDQDSFGGGFRYGDTDSGLGRATPDRRAPSPGMRHLPSPSGPGSLPGLMSRGRRMFDDGSSDISSTPSSMMDYSGPRLYKQPTTKSNRSIMLNAVEYCVFPGVVNRDAKRRVLEEINRSEAKHFLILFRDAGCQFRALYSYCPESEIITKLYGTGPKQVNDNMFDRFFKYNSGGKCFSQVHTKHLTVTIDAFTIHNSLWQGKKVNLPNKKDMTLVI